MNRASAVRSRKMAASREKKSGAAGESLARNGRGAASRNGRVGRNGKKEDTERIAFGHAVHSKADYRRIEKWMRENLPPPGTPEWEALCTGCGECCADKMWSGPRLLSLTSMCSFLDPETLRCNCYADRFEREPLCMPIGPEIILMGGLPEDCPYVANLPGYKGPIRVNKTFDEC
ncbi:MAG: hypothetical protein V3V62_13715 [bacterium]